jgi:hypothetical protein
MLAHRPLLPLSLSWERARERLHAPVLIHVSPSANCISQKVNHSHFEATVGSRRPSSRIAVKSLQHCNDLIAPRAKAKVKRNVLLRGGRVLPLEGASCPGIIYVHI